jgi:uncharacterized protein YcbX
MNDLATIKEIYFYPIKSLAGIKLEKCLVTKLGIAHPEITQVIDRYIFNIIKIIINKQILSLIT